MVKLCYKMPHCMLVAYRRRLHIATSVLDDIPIFSPYMGSSNLSSDSFFYENYPKRYLLETHHSAEFSYI